MLRATACIKTIVRLSSCEFNNCVYEFARLWNSPSVPITLSTLKAVRKCEGLFDRPNMICYPCEMISVNKSQSMCENIIWGYLEDNVLGHGSLYTQLNGLQQYAGMVYES